MSFINRLKKPEYYLQPGRLYKRIFQARQKQSIQKAQTPWGTSLFVDSAEGIGKAIANSGVYDLALTEMLWRLIEPGNFILDVGANIGYTTGLCSIRGGKSGQVTAFEPNPVILHRLRTNLSMLACNNVQLFDIGLSDKEGTASLVLPDSFNNNEGVAYIGEAKKDERSISILLNTLDNIVSAAQKIDVIKMDVEGHEINVLHGAKRLLTDRKISNILFEDHQDFPSAVSKLLIEYGFTIYRIERGWNGPMLKEPTTKSTLGSHEPTNYLATINPFYVMDKLLSKGYHCLTSAKGN